MSPAEAVRVLFESRKAYEYSEPISVSLSGHKIFLPKARSSGLEGSITGYLASLLPDDQKDRVFGQEHIDIDPTFLGFVDTYYALSLIIPSHFTVVDLGCSYAAQSFFFTKHKRYIGVDGSDDIQERFYAPNTEHVQATLGTFIRTSLSTLTLETTFAIANYVPPWFNESTEIVRRTFPNCFVFYPA